MNFRFKEKLTNALLQCPPVSNSIERRDIIEHLTREIDIEDVDILYRTAPFSHVMRLVQCVVDDIDGLARLAALIHIVRAYEANSRHMQRIYDLCQQYLYIQYYFDGEMLFGDQYVGKESSPNSDDEQEIQEQSIQKFIEICEREIMIDYPEHSLDIQLADPHIEVNGHEDGDEVDLVRSICERVYEEEMWTV